jgi:hypothetical protein
MPGLTTTIQVSDRYNAEMHAAKAKELLNRADDVTHESEGTRMIVAIAASTHAALALYYHARYEAQTP